MQRIENKELFLKTGLAALLLLNPLLMPAAWSYDPDAPRGASRFQQKLDPGTTEASSEARSEVEAQIAAIPEVKAAEGFIPIIVKAIKNRPSFRVKLSFDSEKKNVGPLKEGKAKVLIPFQSDIVIPMDPKKPEAGGEFVFLSSGVIAQADLKLNSDGTFDGKVNFLKNGVKADLETTISYASLPGVQLRFSEIEFLGSGADLKTQTLKITGNCVLKQLVLDAIVKSGELLTEKWIDAKCVYGFVLDKKTDLYRITFDYDSLTEEGNAEAK